MVTCCGDCAGGSTERGGEQGWSRAVGRAGEEVLGGSRAVGRAGEEILGGSEAG